MYFFGHFVKWLPHPVEGRKNLCSGLFGLVYPCTIWNQRGALVTRCEIFWLYWQLSDPTTVFKLIRVTFLYRGCRNLDITITKTSTLGKAGNLTRTDVAFLVPLVPRKRKRIS